jgi:glycosyltransferase involved in cell wall biosynthesis
MQILFLSRWFPYPADNGSRIRIHNILGQLAGNHQVSLLSFEDEPGRATRERIAALDDRCVDVRVVPYRAYQPWSKRSLRGFVDARPRSLVDTFSHSMARALRGELARKRFDRLVVTQVDMLPYVEQLVGTTCIVDDLEVGTVRDAVDAAAGPVQKVRAGLTWIKLSSYLQRTLPRFGACIVVSEQERLNIQRAAPAYTSVSVVPNAIDVTTYEFAARRPRPNTLVFAGALSYRANNDAAGYFLDKIYPELRRSIPSVSCLFTGSTAGVSTDALPGPPGIRFTGHVADIRPIIAESWASIVPLRVGGGTRLKILESMALGTPVISTRKGAQGLDVTHDENILLADGPTEFGECVARVLGSSELRQRLSRAGRELVAARYDWQIVGAQLRRVVEGAASVAA